MYALRSMTLDNAQHAPAAAPTRAPTTAEEPTDNPCCHEMRPMPATMANVPTMRWRPGVSRNHAPPTIRAVQMTPPCEAGEAMPTPPRASAC